MVQAEPSTPAARTSLSYTLRRSGIALLRLGRPADAVADLRQSIAVLRGPQALSPGDYRNIACAQSLLSGAAKEAGSGLTADDGRAEACAAMTSFAGPPLTAGTTHAGCRTSPISPRSGPGPDFQMLMLDMAFPAEPFARRE